jgi:hypothetical protein
MRPRVADTLKTMGYTGTVEEFRYALDSAEPKRLLAGDARLS